MSVIEPVDKDRKDLLRTCRRSAFGHHWEPFQPVMFKPTGLLLAARHVLHAQCRKCETVRHMGIDANGGLLTRRYEYPEDYLMDKDEQAPTAEEQRLWLMRRDRAAGRKRMRVA